MTLAEQRILDALRSLCPGRISHTQISRAAHVVPRHVSDLVPRLEAKGLIRITRSPGMTNWIEVP